MTGYELRLWRKGMGWDQERAAEELGKCLRTYKTADSSSKCNAKPPVLALQRPLKVAGTQGISVACYSVLPGTCGARHPSLPSGQFLSG